MALADAPAARGRSRGPHGASTAGKLLSLPIGRIRADLAAQPREFLNESVCQEYAELIRAGVEMPPIIVYYDGSVYWLASGFHRLRAHVLACSKTIQAEVRQGGLRDAILCACGQNAEHGLRRTLRDKARAVRMLLADKEWSQWSDHAIAKRCAVSHTMVRMQRKRSQAEAAEAASDPERRVKPRTVKFLRSGKVHSMRVPAQETKRENELIAQRVKELRSSLTRTELIESLLGELRELHKTHPWRARADQLLDLYKEVVLPWPP